jgi:hypothetical protein
MPQRCTDILFYTFHTSVAALAVSAPVLAHHSFEVEYDANKIVQGTGVVTKVEARGSEAQREDLVQGITVAARS